MSIMALHCSMKNGAFISAVQSLYLYHQKAGGRLANTRNVVRHLPSSMERVRSEAACTSEKTPTGWRGDWLARTLSGLPTTLITPASTKTSVPEGEGAFTKSHK